MEKLKKFIRYNNFLMNILPVVYYIFNKNTVKGKRRLRIQRKGVFNKHVQIVNHGEDNLIEIGKGCRLYDCKIQIFGKGNKVKIEHDCVCREMDIWVSDGGTIEIGHNSHFVGKIHIACTEGKSVKIGERSLFSDGIIIRTGDSHSILDKEGKRINLAQNVFIGDHVWVGQQVIILKGTNIGDESIVGARSLVAGKNFKKYVILAGNPAKIIKENVMWDHNLL